MATVRHTLIEAADQRLRLFLEYDDVTLAINRVVFENDRFASAALRATSALRDIATRTRLASVTLDAASRQVVPIGLHMVEDSEGQINPPFEISLGVAH